MKYYAIKNGRKTGIFNSWSETESHVKGFPNAKYKSFGSKEEAEEYLGNSNNKMNDFSTDYIAYVDGSFDKKSFVYGSGVVIVHNQKAIQEISFSGSKDEYVESFQIAGEVLASLKAIEWAIENNIQELTICYDYEGIQAWASGEWKSNKPVSKDYKERFEILSKQVNVKFKKVKAHSGVHFNELADELAKKAIRNDISSLGLLKKHNEVVNSELYKFLSDTDFNARQENLIYFENLEISDKRIVKFIKGKWRSQGRKIREIKRLTYKLDLNNKILFATIESNEISEFKFEL